MYVALDVTTPWFVEYDTDVSDDDDDDDDDDDGVHLALLLLDDDEHDDDDSCNQDTHIHIPTYLPTDIPTGSSLPGPPSRNGQRRHDKLFRYRRQLSLPRKPQLLW